jgi:uncharacterized protein
MANQERPVQNPNPEIAMPTSISFRAGSMELNGQLNDSPTARAVLALLPATVRMARWGDEYYGSLPRPLGAAEAPDAREEMAVGELAYWPPGNALCLFFGPTPASSGDEPRAASPVNPIGMLRGDLAALKKLGRSVNATMAQTDS